MITTSSSPNEQQSINGLSTDGKKRLLCPRCDTWVLNLTDHLIKKHHLVSKQERLPFLRLARNRYSAINADKSSTNSFLISPNDHHPTTVANKQYQNIIKKYRKKIINSIPASSSSLPTHETSSTNSNQNLLTTTKQIPISKIKNKDVNLNKIKKNIMIKTYFYLYRLLFIRNLNNVYQYFVNNFLLLLHYKIL
jgi:hypothetical protein